jgi:hypothetical protein
MRWLPILALPAALAVADAPSALRVRATPVIAPCVHSAVRAFAAPAGGVTVEVAAARTPGPADVIVASAVELTRALEGGAAEPNTDFDVARVPWVVQVKAGGPTIRSAQDLAGSGVEIAVPDSPAAYEAFRWARSTTGGRARAAAARELREAPVVLVPLSLAGPGDRIGVDVPSLRARAALAVDPARRAEAEAFLAFLRSEAGQTAFAACRATP